MRVGLWLHTAALLGAVIAVVLGFLATGEMGHDSPGHGLVHVHRDLMLGATAFAATLTACAWWQRSGATSWKYGLAVASLALLALGTVGADRGAELVYRYGVGVAREQPPASSHDHDHDHGGHTISEVEEETERVGAPPPSARATPPEPPSHEVPSAPRAKPGQWGARAYSLTGITP